MARTHTTLVHPERAVALTFDDGPARDFTPLVLDVLARHGVPGTFFVTGAAAEEHPDLIHRILAEGHALGSHSDTHRVLTRLPWRAALSEIRRGKERVENVAGRPVTLFRPPQAQVNLRVAAILRMLRMETWMFNREGDDWLAGMTADTVLERIGAVEAGDVVLFHDWVADAPLDEATRRASIEALDRLIPRLAREGLRIVPLGDGDRRAGQPHQVGWGSAEVGYQPFPEPAPK